MIVLREIRSQVVRVKSISVGVIGSTDIVSLVPIYLVRASEQTLVCRNEPTGGKIELQRLETVLLSVEVDSDFRQRESAGS